MCPLRLMRGGSILGRDIHLSSWGMIDTETETEAETETDKNVTTIWFTSTNTKSQELPIPQERDSKSSFQLWIRERPT